MTGDDDDTEDGAAAAVLAEAAVVAAEVDVMEPAVLVDDSGLVDAMDINIAAADTVLSLIGMTVAAALFNELSPTALADTAARDGEPGELVGTVKGTLEGEEKATGSLATATGAVGDVLALLLVAVTAVVGSSCAD